MDTATWTLTYDGLVIQITAVQDGANVNFTVKVLEGYANVNALYWGDATADTAAIDYQNTSLSGAKLSSINMNGTGVDWDGAYVLSTAGLGKTPPDSYLTKDESISFTVAGLDLDNIDNLGLRATSTSTTEGSIKWVGTEPDPVDNAPPVADAVEVGGQEDAESIEITLTGSDPDAGDVVETFRLVDLPENGTLYTDAAYQNEADTITEYTASGNSLTLYFVPDANFNGEVDFQYVANDGDLDSDPATVTITIEAVNDAPLLDTTASPVLDAIPEDSSNPAGNTIGEIVVDDSVTEVPLDNLAVEAMAIVAVDDSHGTWQYSINGGSNWFVVDDGSLGEDHALLLDSGDMLRFVPDANFNGTVKFEFRAWDMTDGTSGEYADTTTNGGITAYSTDTDTASITVNPMNDAPVANNDKWFISTGGTVTLLASQLLQNDFDIDGDKLTIISVNGSGLLGSVSIVNGNILYDQPANLNSVVGTVIDGVETWDTSFTYTVEDISGGQSTATVNIRLFNLTNSTDDTVNLANVLNGATANDFSILDGGSQEDTLTGAAGGDVLIGGGNNDSLTGGVGNDVLVGDGNADVLNGNAGNDVLRGGTGDDTMDGGDGTEDLIDFSDATTAISFTLNSGLTDINGFYSTNVRGNDKYKNIEGIVGSSDAVIGDTLTGSGGDDIIRGGAGNDSIDGAGGIDLIDFSDATGAISFTLSQGDNAGGYWSSGALAGIGTDSYKNIEGVIGSAFSDTVNGSASADIIRGGAGDDIISGANGADVIQGGQGADEMTGGLGADVFKYGATDLAGGGVDTVTDFNTADGDVINIGDLLIGYTAGNESLFVDIRESGTDSIISVDRDGVGTTYGFQDVAVLENVTGETVASLTTNGNLLLNS